ncbi:hypothetical protein, partial [Allofournierella sp.]|uniref:hypothetical protein n=1 Tax=Allofournierella sp. TaxID=1940256 RepID=UPI003AB5941D
QTAHLPLRPGKLSKKFPGALSFYLKTSLLHPSNHRTAQRKKQPGRGCFFIFLFFPYTHFGSWEFFHI